MMLFHHLPINARVCVNTIFSDAVLTAVPHMKYHYIGFFYMYAYHFPQPSSGLGHAAIIFESIGSQQFYRTDLELVRMLG